MAQRISIDFERRLQASVAQVRKRWRLAAAVASACFAPVRQARGITILDNVDPSQYIALGAQSAYDSAGFVEVLTGQSGNQDTYNFESATLIAPDWVLTAAHGVTVNQTGPAYAASAITFGQGATAPFPATDSVAQVLIEPGFDGNFYAGNDLALIQLSTPITNIAPAKLATGALGNLIGKTATVVGYGYTGTGLTGYSTSSIGTRMAMQDITYTYGGTFVQGGTEADPATYNLTSYSSNTVFTQFESPDPSDQQTTNIMGGLDATPLPLAGSTVPGDSGSGLYITKNGQTYLAAVTSFGANFNDTTPVGEYGDINGYTRISVSSSLSFIDSALVTSSNWALAGGGTWAGNNSWSGSNIPEFAQATANFGSAIQTPSTVSLDCNWTAGTVTFNNTNSYTLTAGNGGSLTLDNGGASATAAVIDNSGNHFIDAPIVLNSNVLFNVVNAGNVLTISGPITGSGGVTITGGGTLRLATGSGTEAVNSVSVHSGATLDITNNSLAINYTGTSPVAAFAAALATGYSGGAWTGMGINSSAVAASPASPILSVGYADGNVDANTAAQPNQVLVKFTLAGDANLDGNVDFTDLFAVGQHLNTTGNDWAQGNFNYAASGAVDFNDLFIIGQNLNQTINSAGQELGGTTFTLGQSAVVGISNTSVAVPEPVLGAALTLGMAGLLARRGRRRI